MYDIKKNWNDKTNQRRSNTPTAPQQPIFFFKFQDNTIKYCVCGILGKPIDEITRAKYIAHT